MSFEVIDPRQAIRDRIIARTVAVLVLLGAFWLASWAWSFAAAVPPGTWWRAPFACSLGVAWALAAWGAIALFWRTL